LQEKKVPWLWKVKTPRLKKAMSNANARKSQIDDDVIWDKALNLYEEGANDGL
jgi:hypothetical protein